MLGLLNAAMAGSVSTAPKDSNAVISCCDTPSRDLEHRLRAFTIARAILGEGRRAARTAYRHRAGCGGSTRGDSRHLRHGMVRGERSSQQWIDNCCLACCCALI